MGKLSRGKKEAAKAAAAKPDASKSDASKSEASTSGQKLTPQKSAQEMSKLSLKDESQHQRQGGPSTSKQSEQSKPPPSEPVTKKPVQGQQSGSQQTQSIQEQQQPSSASAWGQSQQQRHGAPPQQRPAHEGALGQRPAGIRQQSTPVAGPSGQRSKEKPRTPKPSIIPYDYKICEYKGAGKVGRSVEIETNYLKLDVAKLVDCAYHYDVTIDFEPVGRSQPNKKFMHPVFAAFVEKNQRNFAGIYLAYDGQKSAYAPQKLNLSKPYEQIISYVDTETGQQRTFKVEIQEVKDSSIDLKILKNYSEETSIDKPMRAIQCLDIVLKGAFQNRGPTRKLVGRSFYMRPDKPIDLGDNYELWTGMFQSTILGQIPYVNIDIAHKAFPIQTNLIELIEVLHLNVDLAKPLGVIMKKALSDHLKGLDIGYNMPGARTMVFKFAGLTESAANQTFRMEDGKDITVEKYYSEKYKHRLSYPQMPCISNMRRSYFPLELCHVIGGQAVKKKTTENQTRMMVREAATSTDFRKNKIMEILNKIKYNDAASVKGFGLNVAGQFAKIPARILNPPMLEYSKNKTVLPSRGAWRAENIDFIVPQKNINWGVLILDYRTQRSQVEAFCKTILNIKNGMAFNPNYFIEVYKGNNDGQLEKQLDIIKDRKCNVLFCVIPDRDNKFYASVKQVAELRCGVLTQCIKAGTVFRKGTDGSTVSNILLKVNAKLNGFNHKLQKSPILNEKKCMLIGADVTHPSPEQKTIPSVVGVAASHDLDGFKYNICWRLQEPGEEMIQDFKEIIIEQLKFYKLKNNFLPDRILYFRDGVSEGQFAKIQEVELKALQNACKTLYGIDYVKKVKITMVVVQKRHHTRFFPGNSGVGSNDRKNNNVPPGTIVDRQITAPNENHFYLVSHQSIQGVARPTKYCILYDEAKWGIDELQALTFSLCHLFTRCNRSVSYPAPTYYAHLVAYRGRIYIEGKDLNMKNLEQEWRDRVIQPEIKSGLPMFFV